MNYDRAIAEGLFSHLDPLRAHLIGSFCKDCRSYAFPQQTGCSRCCGTAVEPVELSRTGTLWTWTLQAFRPPAPPYRGPDKEPEDFQPFLLGMIELPGECRVLGRILANSSKDIEIGMPVELTLFPYTVDETGQTVLSYAFKPVSA
jgi:uncharacterized OB-fold protein